MGQSAQNIFENLFIHGHKIKLKGDMMRNESEIFDLILSIARNDERIRAVYMNGSRTNPNVPKDIFQDYDIVYVVTETASFIKDEQWVNVFGDLIMVQEPDKLDKGIGIEKDFKRSYAYLMLFKDGTRIDLQIKTKESMYERYLREKLTVPLFDKDFCLPDIPSPSDIDYHIVRPTVGQYHSCTNNFWWCLQNVAKGMWRDHLPYAKLMFHRTTRGSLDQMVSWWIGAQYDYKVSVGTMNKYFKRYLPQSYWDMYEKTYSNSDYNNMWESIFVTCELFRTLGREVGGKFNFTYPEEDDHNMIEYIRHIRTLPLDAKGIF
jgi:aminoglycoside 6-adenylyltransferase